jgi:hypothetical protein
VVVDRSELRVLETSGLELFRSAGRKIEAQVVKSENFRQVRKIALEGAALEVFAYVVDSRNRPTVVKGMVPMRQYQEQKTILAEYPLPFQKRFNWVGYVLQTMRRDCAIVGGIVHVKVGSFTDKCLRVSYCLAAPQRPGGVIAVVDACKTRIDVERASVS